MEHIFYHGTSSLFLRSINKYGLGGINPNEEWKLMGLLKYLYKLSEIALQNNNDYTIIRDTTRAMAFQEQLSIEYGIYKGVHNFSHKNVYLSYGKFKAIVYAVNTEYGSEILTRIITLYRLLLKEKVHLNIPSQLNFVNIEKLEKQHFFPILVGIENIGSSFLCTEYGEPADNYLSKISKLKDAFDYNTFWKEVQKYNFQLLKPVPIFQLKYYKVLHSGNIGSSNFTYNLIEL